MRDKESILCLLIVLLALLFHLSLCSYCRKGGPFQGPKGGSCLTLRKELTEETDVLTKQETLLGRGAWVESREGEGTQEKLLCHMACSLRFHGDEVSFWVISGQSF